MNIQVRRVVGGFQARFSTEEKFAKKGATKLEAIANLLLQNRKKLGLGKVLWDRSDEWTNNYLAGKANRSKPFPSGIELRNLPKAASKETAKEISFSDLYHANAITLPFYKSLCNLFGDYWDVASKDKTLGDLCELEENQIKVKNQAFQSFLNFGKTKFAHLQLLLRHYDLAIKDSNSL